MRSTPWNLIRLKTKQALLAGLLLSLALALFACGDDDGSGSPTTSESNSTSVTATPTPLALPEDFPSPSDAEVTGGTDEAGLKVLTISTTDSLDDVVAFYEEALATSPWNMTGRSDLPEQQAVVLTFANVEDPLLAGTMTVLRDSQDINTLVTVTFITTAPTPTPQPPS